MSDGSLTGACHCGRVRWTTTTMPTSVTACSCTICRRYGALWAYGYLDEDIDVSGETETYLRPTGNSIIFHRCGNCGCITHFTSRQVDEDGRNRCAVNIRMSDPDTVAGLAVDHFDGLESWEDLPPDGRRVRDLWF